MKKSEILKILGDRLVCYYTNRGDYLRVYVKEINWACIKEFGEYILRMYPIDEDKFEIVFDSFVEID